MKYFISEAFLKESTPLGANLDIKTIASFIPSAQDTYTQSTLGSNFYKYLWDKYQNAPLTLTTAEQELIYLIKPALAYRSADKAMPFITAQIFNKGPQQLNGDNSTSISFNDMTYLRKEMQNMAAFYEERIKKYLCDNEALFPEYVTNNTTDMEPNKKTNYTSALYISKKYTGGGCC
jgi:hypothetical protein